MALLDFLKEMGRLEAIRGNLRKQLASAVEEGKLARASPPHKASFKRDLLQIFVFADVFSVPPPRFSSGGRGGTSRWPHDRAAGGRGRFPNQYAFDLF